MWLVLLAWLAGSAIFIAGWVLGAIMERRHAVSGTQGAECEACLLRAIEAQLAGEPLMPSAASLE